MTLTYETFDAWWADRVKELPSLNNPAYRCWCYAAWERGRLLGELRGVERAQEAVRASYTCEDAADDAVDNGIDPDAADVAEIAERREGA